MLACLEKLIGVSKLDCPCVTDGLTQSEKDALVESTSGLYMDELPGGLEFKVLRHLDSCRNLATIMLGARDRAIQRLQDDLIIAISNKYSKAVNDYRGQIGRPSYAVTLSNARQFQGMRLIVNNHTDATLKITRLRLIGNASVAVNLFVVRTLEEDKGKNGVVVWTAGLNTSTNNFATATLPDGGLVLPLRDGNDVFEYWIYFDRLLTAFLPKDCLIDCNCSKSGADALDSYFKIQGISFTDPADPLGSGSSDEYTHGFILDTEIRCETGPLICRQYFENEEVRLSISQAANFKAGELALEEVMRSSEVNRYTLQKTEYNLGRRSHYSAQYKQRVEFVASAINATASDCFECKQRDIFFTGIKS